VDHSSFDRLARLLGGGASRRQALRAILAAAFAGGTAEGIQAAAKGKRGGQDRHGGPGRIGAERKGRKKGNKKRKKNQGSGDGNGTGNGNCAGTPRESGQDFLG
jgi:hypothetical protein